LESAFSWIKEVMETLGLFIPRRTIVKATDCMVKFKYDGSVLEVGSGLRWHYPFLTEIVILTKVRQPLDISTIQLTTKDGISCAVDCSITYYITDPIAYLVENYDSDLALAELISAVLCKKLRGMTFEEIQHSETIDNELTELITVDAEFLGIETEYIRLNSFIKTTAISLLSNTEK